MYDLGHLCGSNDRDFNHSGQDLGEIAALRAAHEATATDVAARSGATAVDACPDANKRQTPCPWLRLLCSRTASTSGQVHTAPRAAVPI